MKIDVAAVSDNTPAEQPMTEKALLSVLSVLSDLKAEAASISPEACS